MGKAAKKKKAIDKHGVIEPPKMTTSKPSAVPVAAGGRRYTVSVALPGSIIANAQRLEAKTNLAGQIGRALAVFCVDEVIVYNDGTVPTEEVGGISEPNTFLAHILQYLETPPYLRVNLFPMHVDLRHAGTLKPLDLPHHLKADDLLPYREGVIRESRKGGRGIVVDVGIGDVSFPGEEMPPYTRVTVHFPKVDTSSTSEYLSLASLAKATDPITKLGYYWGYTTRQASSLSAVISESPYENGYDMVIGTSERGTPMSPELISSLPQFSHLLIVLGGQAGIEAAAENDKELRLSGTNISELFDWWVNCVPGQGSRTIRTEEAIWIVLGQLFGEIQIKGIK